MHLPPCVLWCSACSACSAGSVLISLVRTKVCASQVLFFNNHKTTCDDTVCSHVPYGTYVVVYLASVQLVCFPRPVRLLPRFNIRNYSKRTANTDLQACPQQHPPYVGPKLRRCGGRQLEVRSRAVVREGERERSHGRAGACLIPLLSRFFVLGMDDWFRSHRGWAATADSGEFARRVAREVRA